MEEEYGRKKYVDSEQISHVRDTYRSRIGLMPFAGNFKNDKRFAGIGSLCRCMRNLEDEPHLLSGKCEVFGDIRGKYGELKDDESLVKFFNEVLEMRDALDEAKKKQDQEDLILAPSVQ